MAEIIHEVLECYCKFDHNRPHFKEPSNQYASVFFGIAPSSSSASKSKAKSSSVQSIFLSNNRTRNFFHTLEMSALKARAASM